MQHRIKHKISKIKDIIQNNREYVMGGLCLILMCFFYWSISISPATMAHGYYVTTGKFFAQGMIPWKDFNLMDMPLGIGIIGFTYFITHSLFTDGGLALLLMMVMHTLNVFLLCILLKKNNVKSGALWSTLLFYIILVYSACGINVCLEPFAVFFLLIALVELNSQNNTINVIISALMVVFAVECKIQILALLPAILYCVIAPVTAEQQHWKKGCVFAVTFLIILLLSLVGITLYSGNTLWYENLRLTISPMTPDIKSILYNWSTFAARTSLFLVLPGIFFSRFISRCAYKWITVCIFAVIGIMIIMIFGNDKSWTQLVLPFIILCYGTVLQELGSKYRWIKILLACGFLFPIFLVYREFRKLEMGNTKQEQHEILNYLSSLPRKNAATAVIPFKCAGFQIGAQLFSESNIAVHDPLHTTYGFIDWRTPEQELTDAKSADVIILPTIIYLFPNSYSQIEPEPQWAKDLAEFVRSFPIAGNFGYVAVQKTGDFTDMQKRYNNAEKNLKIEHEKVIFESDEENHDHDHQHEHHHHNH